MSTITEKISGNLLDFYREIKWEGLTGGDTGNAVEIFGFADNTVTVTGTFDSNTLTMQGSNDGTNWFTLKDHVGSDVAFTAAGGAVIAEAPKFIRPSLDAGASADIDVIVLSRK
jgi:hypothetical protein